MLSFQTRSYFEWIWNAIKWVDYTTRAWDIYNLDDTIIKLVADWVPMVLDGVSEDNKWYKEVKEMGEIAKVLSYWITFQEEEEKRECFAKLLWKHLYRLWF